MKALENISSGIASLLQKYGGAEKIFKGEGINLPKLEFFYDIEALFGIRVPDEDYNQISNVADLEIYLSKVRI